MRKLIKALYREFQKRPLLGSAGIAALICLLYVNYTLSTLSSPYRDRELLNFTGTITKKMLDADDVLESVTVKSRQNVICYVNKSGVDLSSVPIGATVKLCGTVGNFSPATNPGEFDARNYHFARREMFYVNLISCEIISCPKIPLREKLFQARQYATTKVLTYARFEAGTINTLLFADKRNLPAKRYELYKRSNLSHFLVISGLHLQILAGSFFKLLKKLFHKKLPAILITLLFVFTYGLMVGFSFSIIRAAIMFLFRLIALLCKRAYDSLSALGFAMTVTLIRFPFAITDAAFLYSYVAVLSIAIFYTFLFPISEKQLTLQFSDHSFSSKIKLFAIRSIRLPVFLYLSMLPITLSFSQESYPLSIILNLILALFSAPAILFSFFSCLFSCMNFAIGAGIFDFFLAILLRFMDKILELFPKNSMFFLTGKPTAFQILVFYLILFVCFYRKDFRNPKILTILILSAVCVLLFKFPFSLSYSMLDIGQGDCNVLKISPHSAVLIDAGSSSQSNIGEKIIIPALKSDSITSLSAIYISHEDADHINAVCDLIRSNFPIQTIYLPITLKESDHEEISKIVSLALENDINIRYLKEGDCIRYPFLSLNILWPNKNSTGADSNENSMVIRAYGTKSILFTGDATFATEEKLLKSESISPVNLLKVSHHGSSSSTSETFLIASSPTYAFISAGKNNHYNHPHEETLSRLSKAFVKTFCTKSSGMLRYVSFGNFEFVIMH